MDSAKVISAFLRGRGVAPTPGSNIPIALLMSNNMLGYAVHGNVMAVAYEVHMLGAICFLIQIEEGNYEFRVNTSRCLSRKFKDIWRQGFPRDLNWRKLRRVFRGTRISTEFFGANADYGLILENNGFESTNKGNVLVAPDKGRKGERGVVTSRLYCALRRTNPERDGKAKFLYTEDYPWIDPRPIMAGVGLDLLLDRRGSFMRICKATGSRLTVNWTNTRELRLLGSKTISAEDLGMEAWAGLRFKPGRTLAAVDAHIDNKGLEEMIWVREEEGERKLIDLRNQGSPIYKASWPEIMNYIDAHKLVWTSFDREPTAEGFRAIVEARVASERI